MGTYRITLVITGGIAAYKSLTLIRRLKESGVDVVPVMTEAAKQFITPLSVASLAESPVFDSLWNLKDETEMGHIRLMRDSDLVLVAPASADFLAKMAHGFADDLASTSLLASNKPIFVAPSMNPAMWHHPATQENCDTLRHRGVQFWGPTDGDMACGDVGSGRMVEPEDLASLILTELKESETQKLLHGKTALVTAGPTRETIDPVRFVSNHSSGKQGYAIAQALAAAGAKVTLVTGPTSLTPPSSVTSVHVENAQDMLAACQKQKAVDIAVFCAAVADWRVDRPVDQKLKKTENNDAMTLNLVKNPDILSTIAHSENRPKLVVGFAAETENLVENAREKLERKGADLIVANLVSTGTTTFGGDNNHVALVCCSGTDTWPSMSKTEVAHRLTQEIARRIS